MIFLLILAVLLLIAAAIITALFLKPVTLSFSLDTNRMDMHADVRWLSFIRLELRVINYRLYHVLYLFEKRVHAGFMKPKKKKQKRKAHLGSLELSNTHAKISYGLNEPHLTGIFCAAADFAASLVGSAVVELDPDFYPEAEFLIISARTDLNAGKTLVNMIRDSGKQQTKKKLPASLT